jgi:uncharacterized membrane protein
MRAQLIYLKYKLSSSYWFVPGLMILGAIALAFGIVRLDHALLDASIDVSGWLYSGTPAGARQLLATIASAIITATSLVFSMTLIALTLASQQLGPRLLENFKRDRVNQSVLGFFVATFVYSLLVLLAVSDVDKAKFVPVCATVGAIAMSIVSFGFLIFFIHHVAGSIQADDVVANVSNSLERLIEANLVDAPEGADAPKPTSPGGWPEDFEDNAVPVRAVESGYIETLDFAALESLSVEQKVVMRVDCRPGHFVVRGFPIAYVYPTANFSDELRRDIDRNIVFGPKRTPAQDVEYEIRVIAEIAVRALSPSLNDYYTAVNCVDRLTAALVSILHRDFPPADRCDAEGKVVLRTVPPDFEGMLGTAFHDIRQSAHGNTAVTTRLLEALSVLALASRHEDQRQAVERQAEMIGRAAAEFIFDSNDRSDVDRRLDAVRRNLAQGWSNREARGKVKGTVSAA